MELYCNPKELSAALEEEGTRILCISFAIAPYTKQVWAKFNQKEYELPANSLFAGKHKAQGLRGFSLPADCIVE